MTCWLSGSFSVSFRRENFHVKAKGHKGCDQPIRFRDGRLESSARSPDVVTKRRTELAKLCKGITAHLDQQREEEIVMLPWVTVVCHH